MNYLRSQLRNEAKDVIAGLEVTNASYAVAVDLLKERYDNKQLMIDAHYSQLRDIPTTSTYYEKLRNTFDQIERHLRSLEALGQNIENEFMVSLIRSKLPKSILAKLEEYKTTNDAWTVTNLRKELKKYISTQELGDRLTKMNRKQEDRGDYRRNQRFASNNGNQTTGAFSVGELNRKSCIYCGKTHWSDECNEYPDLTSRKDKAKGHCFICLRKGHLLKECSSTKACVYCKKKGNHHRSLCPNQFSTTNNEVSTASIETKETNLVATEERVIMQTALINLTNGKNETQEDDNKQQVRVLMDSGSQRTYISKDIADKLKLIPIDKKFLTIYTFGTTKPRSIETPVVEVNMLLKSGFTMKIKANVVPNITGTIERKPIDSKLIKEKLKSYELADTLPLKNQSCNIDLLIGNDYFADIVSMKRISLSNGLYLLGSKFGWILSGRTKPEEATLKEDSISMLTHSSSSISSSLFGFEKADESVVNHSKIEDFWALETIGIKDCPTMTDDDQALSEFNKSIKLVSNRYQVRWPWRKDHPTLPENYKLAYGRLVSTIKRLKEDPETLRKYNEIIEDQIKKGIIERVDINSIKGEIKHYIPHHGVVKPNNRTTKLRIVYDASAKSKRTNPSLNECLYRGPVMLEDLCSLLMRFRTYETAIVADIEKAFLQINLCEEDRDVTRFLWLLDFNKPATPDNVAVFRFTRIPWGVISSPFILAATITHHLRSKEGPIAEKLSKNLYVDNLITGTNSIENGTQIYKEGKEMFKEMSMNLREWGSNSKALQETFKKEDKFDGTETKVLGMTWNLQDDSIYAPIKDSDDGKIPTKRLILKKTAAIFDPLGFFNPVIMKAKLLLRELWKINVEWDEPIKDQYANQWKSILGDLKKIEEKKLPRFVGSEDPELLCFCDASGKAFGTTIYMRCKKENQTMTNLIFSKSRIAPLKETSLPRLELLAVLIGARSINFVEKSLQLDIKKKILWTDSQCVLHWLKSQKILSPFVQRRINEIHSIKDIEFRYVSTDQNPADIASRSCTAEQLNESDIWWHGPRWLRDKANCWPTWNTDIISKEVMEKISAETKGPKVLYEVSTLAKEDLVNYSQEDQKVAKNQLPPFEIDSLQLFDLLGYS